MHSQGRTGELLSCVSLYMCAPRRVFLPPTEAVSRRWPGCTASAPIETRILVVPQEYDVGGQAHSDGLAPVIWRRV